MEPNGHGSAETPRPTDQKSSITVAIIGGGVAGCIQAIYLAEAYPWLRILIFEKNTNILSGTSRMNPGRSNLGFHYRHLETAIFCQDTTVKFAKFIRRIGCQHIFAQAPQRGIYVIMESPIQLLGNVIKPVFYPEEVVPVFEQIKAHAIEKYTDDRDFENLFGPPKRICRQLARKEYESFLAPGILGSVATCYETAEMTFNTDSICSFLSNYIQSFKNISIRTETKVTQLQNIDQADGGGYRIGWSNLRNGKYQTDAVQLLTLACWENIGIFRQQLNKPGDGPTHNRLKMLGILDIHVQADLLKTIRPIFVASGPFCMICPQELIEDSNGHIHCICACTLAIATNVMTVLDSEPIPFSYERMLSGTISHEERIQMANPILLGAKQYFACLKDADLIDVRFGTVRVPYGDGHSMDLHDAASEHHRRNYPGCYRLGDGLYVNEAMKVAYSVYNAEMLVDWVGADISG